MSEELLKIADGLLAVSEGVRALAGWKNAAGQSADSKVWGR